MKTSLIMCLLYAAVCFADVTINVKDVYVRLGEEAVIPCSYESDSVKSDPESDPDDSIVPKFKWYTYKNGASERFYTYQDGNANGVTVEASAAKLTVLEDGSLKVPEATWTVADNFGELACEVELGKLASVTSETFKLVVISIPKSDAEPVVYQDKNEGFEADDFATIIGSCESPPSYPAGTIMFYKNTEDGQSLSSNDITDFSIDEILNSGIENPTADGHTVKTTKDLMKPIDKSDHKAEFVCNVKVEVDGKVLFETNKTMPVVNVKYATDMVEWAEKPVAIVGQTITIRCIANGFPEPTIKINGEEGAVKEITVTEEMTDDNYQCSASNNPSSGGVTSSIYTINVYKIDEPVITGDKLMDGKGMLKEGDTATFECAGSGNPEPSFAWYAANGAKVADSGTLTITKATLEGTSKYSCRAYIGEVEDLQRTVTLDVVVQGLQLSGDAEEIKKGKEGDTFHLECAVYSNPAPKFEWNIEDVDPTETKTDDLTYTSQIHVGPLTPEDSEKEYVCTATTKDGYVIKSFKMPEIKRNVTTAAIASGAGATTGIIIAVLVIILVIAIVVAVLYNKGIICKKQEKGVESAEGEIDVAINNDEKDVEAGNGKPAETPVEEQPEEEKLMNGDEIEK